MFSLHFITKHIFKQLFIELKKITSGKSHCTNVSFAKNKLFDYIDVFEVNASNYCKKLYKYYK